TLGPPPAVVRKRPLAEPRLGPLPEPSLIDRLRASWSLAALVPAFDPRGFKKREWRSAAILAILGHVAVFAAIVIIGKLAIVQFVDHPKTQVAWVAPPKENMPPDEVAPPNEGDDPGGPKGETSPGSGSPGGGSNHGPTPVTQGDIPRSLPTPPIV